MRRVTLLPLLAALSACTFDPAPVGGRDAGALPTDAASEQDTGPRADAEVTDLGPQDGGAPDADPLDAGAADVEAPDAEIPDAEVDAGAVDAGLLPVCGDGRIEASERCDDANEVDNDGCTDCGIDLGFACEHAPSICAPINEVTTVDGADPNCRAATDEPGTAPWCTIEIAFDLDPTPSMVVVRTSTYTESLSLDGVSPVSIVAPDGATWVSSSGPAVFVHGGADVVIAGFTITGSGSAAGGVKVENNNTRLTLLDNVIGPADARGVDLRGGGHLVMRRNVVKYNLLGGLYLDSHAGYDIANNVIVHCGGGEADFGGVRIKKTGPGAAFVNNSISDCQVDDEPAGVWCNEAAFLTNVIVWGNLGAGQTGVSDMCLPRFSILQGMHTGPGNRFEDPLFVDDLLRVDTRSPAIDHADPLGVVPGGPAPDRDFSLFPRPAGADVDIGAHETR